MKFKASLVSLISISALLNGYYSENLVQAYGENKNTWTPINKIKGLDVNDDDDL